jgi:predicted transcriptional regulator
VIDDGRSTAPASKYFGQRPRGWRELTKAYMDKVPIEEIYARLDPAEKRKKTIEQLAKTLRSWRADIDTPARNHVRSGRLGDELENELFMTLRKRMERGKPFNYNTLRKIAKNLIKGQMMS